jgi:hypothetical protein
MSETHPSLFVQDSGLAAVLRLPTAPGRESDPDTSQRAATGDLAPLRRATQKHFLLIAYGDAGGAGLTDEEAARRALIAKGCPWKRCSELRDHALIEPTDSTRPSENGGEQRVCRITFAGRRALGLLS